ncbi:MAG: penicillin-binding protein 2 [Bacteroidota bacterium]
MKPDLLAVQEKSGLRLAIFSGLVVILLGLLSVRLVQMQLLDRGQYSDEALANSVDQKVVGPARGLIYDRNGILLVDNEPIYSLTLAPRYFEREKLGLLARLAGVPDSLAEAKYDEIRDYSSFKSSLFLKDIPFQAFARVKEESWRLPGVGFEIAQKRGYHTEARASHALGYVREITDSQLEQRRQEGYRLGDIVGQTGIEESYETVLRGRPGREFVLVNVHGMEVMPFEEGTEDIDPQSGYELHLTLDAKVQALAESLMVNMRGGVVALDAQDGGIIAMASAPDYDPTKFAGRLSQDFVDYIYRNEAKPLFNRATQSSQPPGSTWKPFMAAVALEEGMITEDTDLYCGGGYVLGGRLFKCHGGSHGNISVKRSIQVSCNTFYFRLMNDRIGGKRLDLTTWSNWARRFGFGTLAPLDFPDQRPGLIPDSSYFDRIFPHGWGPGVTINLGIGQGNMGTTPLQLARQTAAIANGGRLVTPHLVGHQLDTETGERVEPRHSARSIPISDENLDIVRRGMELVVEAGTARRAQIEGIAVAGKTGTSQNPHGEDHSVFIAYAPADDPQIAVAAIIENAGYGSTAAAPIASLLIEQYLTGEIGRPGLVEFTRAQRSEPIENAVEER